MNKVKARLTLIWVTLGCFIASMYITFAYDSMFTSFLTGVILMELLYVLFMWRD